MNKQFKYRIEQELIKQNWEIVQINSTEEWWDDEHWTICSKQNPTVCFYLCFIVDPMFENDGKQKSRIYEIKAVTEFPENWNDDRHAIASIQMQKINFDQKLGKFIENIKRQWRTT